MKSYLILLVFLLFVLAACSRLIVQRTTTETPFPPTQTPQQLPTSIYPSSWSPEIGASLQWQLTDYPPDISYDVDVYDLDLFEVSVETIRQLHDAGKHVICYLNVGAWENWRPDADLFPAEVIGRSYPGWPGEKWLDISKANLFQDILLTRLDLAVEKGCDAIEADNISGFQQQTGFEIKLEQQINFNLWLAHEVHLRGMSIGMKNTPELIPFLIDYYDWALLEDCSTYGWCREFQTFIKKGKAVFQVEYTDTDVNLYELCHETADFFKLYKKRNLDNWVKFCS